MVPLTLLAPFEDAISEQKHTSQQINVECFSRCASNDAYYRPVLFVLSMASVIDYLFEKCRHPILVMVSQASLSPVELGMWPISMGIGNERIKLKVSIKYIFLLWKVPMCRALLQLFKAMLSMKKRCRFNFFQTNIYLC